MNLGFIDRIEPLNTGWLFKKSCDAHILPHGRRTNFAYQRYWEAIGATCNFAGAQILWISSLFLPMILSKTVLSGHEFIPRWIFYTRIICQLDDTPRWIFCSVCPFVLKKWCVFLTIRIGRCHAKHGRETWWVFGGRKFLNTPSLRKPRILNSSTREIKENRSSCQCRGQ